MLDVLIDRPDFHLTLLGHCNVGSAKLAGDLHHLVYAEGQGGSSPT